MEPGRTRPATRPIAIRIRAKASRRRRGRTSSQTSGRIARSRWGFVPRRGLARSPGRGPSGSPHLGILPRRPAEAGRRFARPLGAQRVRHGARGPAAGRQPCAAPRRGRSAAAGGRSARRRPRADRVGAGTCAHSGTRSGGRRSGESLGGGGFSSRLCYTQVAYPTLPADCARLPSACPILRRRRLSERRRVPRASAAREGCGSRHSLQRSRPRWAVWTGALRATERLGYVRDTGSTVHRPRREAVPDPRTHASPASASPASS